MSRLRDNQSLRGEIIDIIVDGRDENLVLARVSERILDAVDRALTATGPGSGALPPCSQCGRLTGGCCTVVGEPCETCRDLLNNGGECGDCRATYRAADWRPAPQTDHRAAPEATYPCSDCGELRTRAQGGTIFTVCDACWDIAAAENTIPRAAPQTDHRAAPACSVVRYDGKPCGCGGVGSVRHVPRGTQPREPGCQCHQEIGDSPCRVHGEEEDEPATPPSGSPPGAAESCGAKANDGTACRGTR